MKEWHEEEKDINWPRANDRNPRKISKEALERLKSKIQRLGYHQPIACQPDGLVISGHQRLRALRELGFKTIRITLPPKQLTDAEYREMLIEANVSDGDWDREFLSADFEAEELEEWGVSAKEHGLFKAGSADDQGRLDTMKSKMVHKCPSCGTEFTGG
jgi:site-specific DNA-methyltransferase (adenine-specific)